MKHRIDIVRECEETLDFLVDRGSPEDKEIIELWKRFNR